jgi:hypothetical protein
LLLLFARIELKTRETSAMNTPEPGITALTRGGTPAAPGAGRPASSVCAQLHGVAAGCASTARKVTLAA